MTQDGSDTYSLLLGSILLIDVEARGLKYFFIRDRTLKIDVGKHALQSQVQILDAKLNLKKKKKKLLKFI